MWGISLSISSLTGLSMMSCSIFILWCERMYLCGFVTLYVRIFVARANKVEGTIS